MIPVLVATVPPLLVLVIFAIRAHRTLPPAPQLPMQFGFDGKPTWFAPRIFALALFPVMTLLAFFLGSGLSQSDTAPQGTGMWISLSICLPLMGIQQLHFRLIRNWFEKGSAY